MNAKKVASLGLCISLAMILSFVESQVPAIVPVYGAYGIKVGLPNLVMVYLLYHVGWRETIVVSIIRLFLVSLIFGNLQSMTFSMAGAVLSLCAMILLKKTNWFSCIAVSIVGGISHNVGQILAACFWTGTKEIVYYLPVLLISGTVSGTLIGIISGILAKRLGKRKH